MSSTNFSSKTNTIKIKIRSHNNKLYNFDVDKTSGAVPSLIHHYPNIRGLAYTVDNGDTWSL